KRTGYPSRGGQHVAPTLLTESFRILPQSEGAVAQMQTQFRNWMLGVVGVVVAGLAVLIWWFVRADQKYHHSRLYEIATSRLGVDAGELQALAELSEEEDPREATAGSEPDPRAD